MPVLSTGCHIEAQLLQHVLPCWVCNYIYPDFIPCLPVKWQAGSSQAIVGHPLSESSCSALLSTGQLVAASLASSFVCATVGLYIWQLNVAELPASALKHCADACALWGC